MKKIFLLVAVAVATITTSFAQSTDYKPFKIDVGALFAIPSGNEVKAGGGFYVEPKYNISNNIAVGFKMEWILMGTVNEQNSTASISTVSAYQITGDYYFNTNKVRPFAGLGMGIYSVGTFVDNPDRPNNPNEPLYVIDYGSKFGFAPRIGVLIGHFRVALEYNAIAGVANGSDTRNYLSLKLGCEIGGGRK